MKAEIVFTKDRLPKESSFSSIEPTEYLWVMTLRFGNMKAMFIEGGWWTSHASKLMDDVVWWVEITK